MAMPPPTRTPPSKWIEEGLRALAAGGPDAVRVEALARELGVTKGGFYNHFEDRPALIDEMLDTWERLVIDQVIDQIEARGGDAKSRLRHLFAFDTTPARKLVRIELAIREWSRRDKAVARRLKRIDNRRLDYLRALFAEFCPDKREVEVRCLVVMSLFLGQRLFLGDHGPYERSELITRAQEQLLEG
jgi:AcrR family transcriptional regulator